MISSTLYIRVVTQDKERGYMLLCGFEPGIVQSTCTQYTTLSAPSRASLDAAIAQMKERYGAADVKDVTAEGLKRKLAKMFGEV